MTVRNGNDATESRVSPEKTSTFSDEYLVSIVSLNGAQSMAFLVPVPEVPSG